MSTLQSQLIGAWELVSLSYSTLNHNGMIVYTADGYMSAQIQTPGQSNFKLDGPHDGTDEEYAQAGRNYLAYAGPYYVDESGKEPVLLHNVTVSSFPNWLGKKQRRIPRIWMEGGDTYLTLSTEKQYPYKGTMVKAQMKWRRLPNNNSLSPPAL